jgi:hypothetical protein
MAYLSPQGITGLNIPLNFFQVVQLPTPLVLGVSTTTFLIRQSPFFTSHQGLAGSTALPGCRLVRRWLPAAANCPRHFWVTFLTAFALKPSVK